MNIKIKSSGVSCLVGDDYDRVYTVLKKQLDPACGNLFSERIPGHEYLQWVLPGDGWASLADGDPIMSGMVRSELHNRQQIIMTKFGANTAMAQKVLTVPDDSFIYYKSNADGHLDIRLTAWGYRYPERINGGDTTSIITPKVPTEPVCVQLIYDGQPMPGKPLRINGYLRATDKDGRLEIGDLPLGYQFDIDVDDTSMHHIVNAGNGNITIDCTKYTTVEVIVSKDSLPYGGADVHIAYGNTNQHLKTDSSGHASTKVPVDPKGSACNVSVDGEVQESPLNDVITTFRFNLTSPQIKVPEKEYPPVDDNKSEDTDDTDSGKYILADPPEKDDDNTDDQKDEPDDTDDEPEEEEEVEEEKEEPEETPAKRSWWSILLGILFALLLLLLIIATYIFGRGMLFG